MGLVVVIVCTMSATKFAYGQETISVSNKDTLPKVIIEDTELEVPNSVVEELIQEHPDAGKITIYEYSYAQKDSNSPNKNNLIQPLFYTGVYYTNVIKTVTNPSILFQDAFVTSVAKGQVHSLESEWTYTLSCKISGPIDVASLEIAQSMTKTYKVTDTFYGPPEDSPYNCRIFRCKFYYKEGNYTATCHDPWMGWYITYPVSGTYTEPTYYLSYSYDSLITP